MDIYIPLAIILIFIAFVNRNSESSTKKSINISLAALLIFGVLRYNFGPDYTQYKDVYDFVSRYGYLAYTDFNKHMDSFFVYVLSFFPHYFIFTALEISLWLAITFYYFKKYLDYRYWWFALAILFFDASFFINNTVAMRSSIASSLILIGFVLYTQSQKRIFFVAFAILACLFHKSAFASLPILFITARNTFSSARHKSGIIVIVSIGILSIILANTLMIDITNFFFEHFPNLEEEYAVYQEMNHQEYSGFFAWLKRSVLIIFNILPILAIWNHLQNENEVPYIKMEKISMLFLIFNIVLGLGLFSRFMMLVAPIVIICIIRSFRSLSKVWTIMTIISMLIVAIYSFYNIMSTYYAVSFLKYHTILNL